MSGSAGLVDALRQVPLFAGETEEDLRWLAESAEQRTLAPGEALFRSGEPATHFYVLLEGDLLQADTERGMPSAARGVVGETPLLTGSDYTAAAVADGAVSVLAYPRDVLFEILTRCPGVTRALVPILAWRAESIRTKAEGLAATAAYDTLAASLAHELNNPVAVVDHVARGLTDIVQLLVESGMGWGAAASPAEYASITAMIRAFVGAGGTARAMPGSGSDAAPTVDAIMMAESEDALAQWAAGAGAGRPDLLATVMAERGLRLADLRQHTEGLSPRVLPAALDHLAAVLETRSMAAELAAAGARVAALVTATRDYSQWELGTRQTFSVVDCLESALVLLRARLRSVRIVRDYGRGLPLVHGHPSELNRVWVNLLENALDAMGGRGTLTLRVRDEGGGLLVEVADTGSGIPSDVLPHIFEPFYTTKDMGKGSGLGLHLAHQIVTRRHRGTISARSVPGETRIEIHLPVDPGQTEAREPAMATYDISKLHPVFRRQMEALDALDLEALMKNYTDDAVLLRYEGVSTGIEAVRETFTGYLTVKPKLVELQEYVETEDTIFYRAIMNLNGEPEHAFGTLVVRDNKIWRQTAGFGS